MTLSPDAVATIRAALVAGLEREGEDIDYEHEPVISDDLRDFEQQMRTAVAVARRGAAMTAPSMPSITRPGS